MSESIGPTSPPTAAARGRSPLRASRLGASQARRCGSGSARARSWCARGSRPHSRSWPLDPRLGAAAALSAAGLAAFVPPAGVTRLVIAPDNDVAGTQAAERLQRRCEDRGVGAIVFAPERNDFNDDLRALGAEALAARLARAVAMIAGAAR